MGSRRTSFAGRGEGAGRIAASGAEGVGTEVPPTRTEGPVSTAILKSVIPAKAWIQGLIAAGL
ncbi:DUF6053 domain-containing protein [Lysobacter yananisis]|uniref:DUF6053 domain-containing protein n=1 Tax=Lysobacter yananisis TaxID=1003114 RepID=UPI003CE50E9F